MGSFGPSNPVFAMLKQDHAKVKKLFEDFERAIEASWWAEVFGQLLYVWLLALKRYADADRPRKVPLVCTLPGIP